MKDTPAFASVVGGYNIAERLRCAKSLYAIEFDGYILDGFHLSGESATKLKWEEMDPVITETLVSGERNETTISTTTTIIMKSI